jgi:glutamyl-tRNA reductase
MTLITLGLNHKTTPIEMRERLSFTPENLPTAVQSLLELECISEAAILSTCNRTEVYCSSKPCNSAQNDCKLVQWFSQYHGFSPDELNDHLYFHHDAQSIRHALCVASGLDSMVLGEPQILGQMKQAYAQANELGTMGTMLGKLFQHAFSVAKQIRTDTAIGSSPVSVAFAAVNLSRQIFGDLDGLTALMIGAGETIELAAQHLRSKNIQRIIIANRTIERAQGLADKFDAEAIALPQIPEYLHKADIVISSTASPLPILGKGAVEKALKKRKHRPMFMVDIAVPRDVEAEVGELDDVYLYTVDDLQEIIQENLKSRQQAAEQAHEIIDVQVQTFLDWQRSLQAVDVIREIRKHTEKLSHQVLQKTLKQVAQGKDIEAALSFMARSLTNKFLHQPSIQLRQASLDNRHDLIAYTRSVFLHPRSKNAHSKNKK